MPNNHAMTSDGVLIISNGIDPIMRWDGFTGEIEEAGITPPASAVVMSANTDAGSINGTYYAYLRFVDRDGNVSNLSPLSSSFSVSSKSILFYSSVEIPTESRVVRRQILRNTSGQTSVFYVDVDTTNLTSTTLESKNSDSVLSAQEAVPLFDINGNILADLHTKPPDSRAFIASHLQRMFLAGEEIYTQGSVKVTTGSKTVYGIGTEWPANFTTRFLWIPGSNKAYEIDEVDSVNQTITLLDSYASTSRAYTEYAIRAALDQRRLLYFSEASKGESWPAINAMEIQEDNDEITGLMVKGTFVYILERRHIYQLTYRTAPDTDGYIFLNANRGCINNRCWVAVDDSAYLLDESGLYRFTDGEDTESISAPIQDIFEPAFSRSVYRIRWEAQRWFHASYDFGQQTIRWFVTLSGTGYPRHAICYSIDMKRFWIEEYEVPICSSEEVIYLGERRVVLGGPSGQIYMLGRNTLDLVSGNRGTVRGYASSSTATSLTDTAATFGDDLTNAPLVIVAGRGVGQRRQIVSSTSTRVNIDRPWTIIPDTTSLYQVGGIKWAYRTGWFRWVKDPSDNVRRLAILFEPAQEDSLLHAEAFIDRSKEPITWDYTQTTDEGNGFGSTKDDTRLVGDLTKSIGHIQKRLDGFRETYIDGPRLISWKLSGVTNKDHVVIYEMELGGVQGER